MADLVGTTTQQEMLSKLNDITTGIQDMGEFSMLHARDFVIYLLITLLIAVLELSMLIVAGFGYLALGAILIIGPILIPFMLVPKLDFLFWSWLKALIKYSFYPVIGNIIISGNLPDHALSVEYDPTITGPYRRPHCREHDANSDSRRGVHGGDLFHLQNSLTGWRHLQRRSQCRNRHSAGRHQCRDRRPFLNHIYKEEGTHDSCSR
jgi:hypothetical protein